MKLLKSALTYRLGSHPFWELGMIFIVYVALGEWMANTGYLTALLSPAGQSAGRIILALLYVALRLFVLLVIPGLLAVSIVVRLRGLWDARR